MAKLYRAAKAALAIRDEMGSQKWWRWFLYHQI